MFREFDNKIFSWDPKFRITFNSKIFSWNAIVIIKCVKECFSREIKFMIIFDYKIDNFVCNFDRFYYYGFNHMINIINI